MTTLQAVELGVLGPLQVRQRGVPVVIPGAKPRAILTMLGLHGGSVVSAETLVELLWGEDPPRTAAKALQTHISALRRALGDGFVMTEGAGWTLAESDVDASRYKAAARLGRNAAAAGDTGQAVARFEEALALWRGIPELPDGRRGISEKTRWIEGHAALVEDRADALLATGRAAEIIGELEAAVADAPLRERRWGQLMLALYRAGRQGEALGAYQRARTLLADELGVDPGPNLRRLEAAIVAQDTALETPVAQQLPAVTRAVTFLLTDIEGSTAAWEADADAMALALARHDELVEQVVTSRGGRLIKTRGEGDATFSVFERPSAAAAAAIELQDAIVDEPWALREPMRIRVALHTGEAELRDGDYFGRAVNRAARLRSLAVGGQILCSGATAELVIDSLPDDVVLADLGMRQLKNLARPEHVFELQMETTEVGPQASTSDAPIDRPDLPAVLGGPGPFVGRGRELGRLFSAWQSALAGGTNAMLIAGEPGVGKTRLAGEWSRQAYDQGALVIYGRCDEDLGAPYQPFAEALRSLVPCLGTGRLRGLRGVEALLPMVPGLTDVLPDLATPTRADPDTERYALFDAVVALLGVASASAPVVLILDDLHWAAKPTLLLLRHILRFGEQDRVQIVGTYRSTDLDRSHPLAAMLADLHRDGTADRIQLSGLDEDDVTAYVAEAGYDDEELARALASVTGGNPFFLIEALRHVEESGGHWDPSTLPQGVREAVSRRLSRLPAETNKALAAAAVVGSRFALELVERVVGDELVDAFDEACKAGIIIEEPGGRYRFNHAIVRQSLLAELASVRRMRLHQRIAATLENEPGADDELLAELAHHYFECAWAGNAVKAVEYCMRAADQAMARLAYEGAADLYDRALHALEEIDDELPNRDELIAALLIARCEALLAAGDVTSAAGAVAQLQEATRDSARLAAWATCFDGQLSMLIHPERLDEVEAAVGAAAGKLAELDDAAGEAMAHTVRAGCLARLGRIGDCEIALDDALTAARRAREHRRVNAVLAGAPLAALWGPNPVPRAGGRCLDVVRLLRITTDSPAVEATSTRCQAVLEAFRGRAAAARRMIDSARRTVTELGLRHALLEVQQFAGIVELVVNDPAAAEPHLRQAYNGFRRMGLDADTAETAALLGRTCLALGRDAEADELCTESERLAGHALKPSIAWRALRAHLLSRGNDHNEARRVAEAAVSLAERTDLLVDHGDACSILATVLGAAGNAAGARAAAGRAADLYERKGAAALAEKARALRDERAVEAPPAAPETPAVALDNACVRAAQRVMAAIDRKAWDEFERLFAPGGSVESRRKIVGFTQHDFRSDEVIHQTRRDLETGAMRVNHVVIAVRGEHLALARLVLGTADVSQGAPQDEFLQLYGIDEEGRIAMQVWFDIEDIDAAMAELDAAHDLLGRELLTAPAAPETPTVELDNTCVRAMRHVEAAIDREAWDEFEALFATDVIVESRRKIVGFTQIDLRSGEWRRVQRRLLEAGAMRVKAVIIAVRGERLALARLVTGTADVSHGAPQDEFLQLFGTNEEGRIALQVSFDIEDIDAATTELDAAQARFGGELPTASAAPEEPSSELVNACVRVIRQSEAAANRDAWDEMERIYAPDVFMESRRKIVGFTRDDFPPGEWPEHLRRLRDSGPARARVVVIAIRGERLALTRLEISTEDESPGAPHEELLQLYGIDEQGRISLQMWFDIDDVDAAFAELDAAQTRFEQEHPRVRRLENAASQTVERYLTHFAARDWDALAKVLADDISTDDRRRIVNAGTRHGRGAEIANLRAVADAGFAYMTSVVIAARGERLILAHTSGRDNGSKEFLNDVLGVIEINSDNQIASIIVFDLDDFPTAIAELDARYLAGEAAPYARTWSVVARGVAALNRREMPPTKPDWVNIDHRRGTSIAAGEMPAFFSAVWNLPSDQSHFHETVHRLNNLGAVVTHVAHETSQQGFHAEWRVISVITVEGDLINRCEVFDDDDLDAAIARYEQLSRPSYRLENAASQAYERILACFMARDWDAVTETAAEDVYVEDRRRVVNAGIRHGLDAAIEDLRASADVGFTYTMFGVMATRGERLALVRSRASGPDPGAIQNDAPALIELDADGRVAAVVVFDLDDFDAALAELDARYLAGEAAAHARAWSQITRAYAGFNRGELPAATQDWVNVDHRHAAAMAPGEGVAYFRASWELAAELNVYIEAVHRLSDLGAVFTHVGKGTSRDGFEAEWRTVDIMTVEADLINRVELFDEADIDVAFASFEQLSPPTPRLENAASQAYERFRRYFAARDWAAMADLLTADTSVDDHRRVVNAETRRGRNVEIENMRAFADIGALRSIATVIATRGERLVLCRTCISGEDHQAGGFRIELLIIVETTADKRILARVAFDPDDIDAAIAELDARYLTGEAAAHAHTWSVIVRGFASVNRHELPPLTPDFVSIDHRRVAAFGPGEGVAYVRAGWSLDQRIITYVESVHRLNDLGAVVTHAAHGSSQEGFDAEWRGVDLLTVDGDMCNRTEVFDEADLDTALARFDQLSRPAPRLENTASQQAERFLAHFAAGNWDTIAEILADDYVYDDRRRVVGAGVRHGRDVAIEDMRTATDVGFTEGTFAVIATRGGRVALTRACYSGQAQRPEAFQSEVVQVVEIDAAERIASVVVFDPNDFEAAIAELDARYLAGEAAAHAHTWSVVKRAYAAANRNEFPATTPDWVNFDHRRGRAFGPGELKSYMRATWEIIPDTNIYIESVHRLSNLGAVVTHAVHGTSRDDFDAEWREISLSMVDGDHFNRSELFDEADLDAAITRFEELSRPAPRLQNAASRTYERLQACFVARDWDAITEMLNADVFSDDRRRAVNAGIRRGRDAAIQDARAMADLWITNVTSTVIATRGERLALMRARYAGRSQGSEAFYTEVLNLIELDAHGRIIARISFDPDFEAAFDELDARYLAGEAAPYANAWSVISGAIAAINRRELSATTPDWVTVDHRRLPTFEAGDLPTAMRAVWDLTPDLSARIEAVHRLSELGAVVTHALKGTSPDGFDAEWRLIEIFTVEGDLLSRFELFDETDLNAALACFEELHPQTPRLENAASRVGERFLAHFAVGDWDALAEMLADDFSLDDRRRVVGAGVRHGRDAEIEDLRVFADLRLSKPTFTIVATRGERLALAPTRFPQGEGSEAFLTEVLGIIEIDADERIVAMVSFDMDDIDAAFEELDARYLAGEAAAHTATWSAILGAFAALNRHEPFGTTPDWIHIDHRPVATFAADDLAAFLRATWELMPDINICIEAVHRLSDVGTVLTHTAYGMSQEGFDAEWRMVLLVTVEGDLINRGEIFDEADLDTAVARFDQLNRPTPRLENATSHVAERFLTYFAARDWIAMAELLADDYSSHDRRRVVGAGVRHGRDAQITDLRVLADLWITNVKHTVIATRGERLTLARTSFSGRDQGSEAFLSDVLNVAEINADERIVANVSFDLDDFDAAFEELDARYLAGDAAAYSRTWSVITDSYAAFNRHEVPAANLVTIDHRRVTPFEPSNMTPSRTIWDLRPDLSIHIEAVHRLNDFGAVITHQGHATSREGFDAEWRAIDLIMVDDDLINRCEVFDEADLEAALTRFEELQPQARRLENAASEVTERFWNYFAARDWAALGEVVADDISSDDRRRVVNAGIRHGRDAEIADMRAIADTGTTNVTFSVTATRGQRLALCRFLLAGRDRRPEAFRSEMLGLVEINAESRLAARVLFDVDEIDAAFEELDARYLAGEAAAHSHMWSVITRALSALNRREMLPTTPDWVNIDHRHGMSFAPGQLPALLALWNLAPEVSSYVEVVHRLNNFGAVVTSVSHETSQDGVDGEWLGISVLTVEGDLVDRSEFFDEADLDAALARFEELSTQTPRLGNAASRADERVIAYFAARNWDGMTEVLADNYYLDDRRPVLNVGIKHGRDVAIADMQASAELELASCPIATRGERLVLSRVRWSWSDQPAEGFHTETLNVIEINTDGRITARIWFDANDIDAAFEELDARYLACEDAAHADMWSVITHGYAALNRHELPATTSDWVTIDHRVRARFEGGDLAAYIHSGWDVAPDLKIYIEAVHRLSNRGAVFTHLAYGTSPEGFDAEWRMVVVLAVGGDQIYRCELFDEADLDAALARFDELGRPARPVENAASQANARLWACFMARDWDAMAEVLADDVSTDDRRRVVSAGSQRGRDVEIANMRAVADIGVTNITRTLIATRGRSLSLSRVRLSGRDQRPEAFHTDALGVGEIGADGRIVATVAFDFDDLDAAFAELDARYLAGEAAAYAHTWSVVARECAAFNRHEPPATTPDPVYIDHRPLVSIEGVDLAAAERTVWELTPDARTFIEAVHRLSELGAVVTQVVKGTSPEGFDAEWQMISIITVEGDLLSRYEVFDEADLDTTLARFDELHPRTRQLENAASRASERLVDYFAARDWAAASETLADDFCSDDRRPVVNAGLRHGRDVAIANMKTSADLRITFGKPDVIATRGELLVLNRVRWSGPDERPQAFHTEVLAVVEVNADERVAARVMFDADDIDAAFEELDARYLAGEAAAHPHTWSLMAQTHDTLNRHKIPPTTPDFVNVDHRRGIAFAPGDIVPYVRAVFDDTPDVRHHIVAVHRLSDLGAVITQAMHGTSGQGLEAEWQNIGLFTFKGDLGNRCEIFDEEDLDAALARFEELQPQTRRLENRATRAEDRFFAYYKARDWAALAEILPEGSFIENRTPVVSTPLWEGRDVVIANMQALADAVANSTSDVVAIRGERLALTRNRFPNSDARYGEFVTEQLIVAEIDTDDRIAAHIVVDPDDMDAAIAELDARYLAGEAATHAHTWSVIAGAYARLNRREVPAAAPDYVIVDHRLRTTIEASDLTAYLRASWDLTPELSIRIEAVHRLSDLGTVVTHAAHGTSPEGLDAEWRMIELLTVEGDLFSRCELFDEADLDAALARFDELQPQTRRLKNAVAERFLAHFAARDWEAMAQDFAEDYYCDDRRRVVNAGMRDGRDAAIEDLRVAADIGLLANVALDIIATRGERLILTRWRGSGREHEAVQLNVLQVIEHDADERIAAAVVFDLEDFDAAIAELDARYLAGEAVARAQTWSVIMQAYAAANRHEIAATSPALVNIDHRRLAMIESGGLIAYLRNTFDDLTDIRTYPEAVHRLTDIGAVVTHVGTGTSEEGFYAEWRAISLIIVEDNLISRGEMFDEADLNAALARFEELQPHAPRAENTASRVGKRFLAHFAARDWDAMADMVVENFLEDDRRKVVGSGVRHGRDAQIADMRAIADLGATFLLASTVATRGERLALMHQRLSFRDQGSEGFLTDVLVLAEINTDERIVAGISFDPDDIDAAFEELDARYLAGEAAPYAHTWSVIAGLNRHELDATTPDSVYIDHRPLLKMEAVDLAASMRAVWDLTPGIRIYIEAVHRLSELGAVVTHALKGTSQEGFDAEWRMIEIFTVEGDLLSRAEVFDEADLDAALARFEELQPQAPRPENAASRADERYRACFVARDWVAMAQILTDDTLMDDRRRVVGIGVRRGRDVQIADMTGGAKLGITSLTETVIATRGERLVLLRGRFGDQDHRPEAFYSEILNVVEIDTDERILARIMFEPGDIEAAFEELDARYLAGEAAAYSDTWSVIAGANAAFNRHELPAMTPDSVFTDHRPLVTIDASDLLANIRATWDLMPDVSMHIEAVHRLNELGAVATQVLKGTTQEGFDAVWRTTEIYTVAGDLVSRVEVFHEADLDAALARFDELHPQAPRPENAASQVEQRFMTYFGTRNWDAIAELIADDFSMDDRRHTVNAGVRHGRDAEIASLRAIAAVGVTSMTLSNVIAIRGGRLALGRYCVTDNWGETKTLCVLEINAENQIVTHIGFDPDDLDAAFEELDARYLAGEAAAHSDAWSVIAEVPARFTRQELPATTPDPVYIDHRPLLSVEGVDLAASIRAVWDITSEASAYFEAVHQLSDRGAVTTEVVKMTSREGLDAELWMIMMFTVEGGLISGVEVFDEADLDAALARFEELQPQARRLENAASHVYERFWAYSANREWDAMAETLADDSFADDRRPVVNAGLWQGRNAVITMMQALEDVRNIAWTVMATRGERLALARLANRDPRNEAFGVEMFTLVEIDADNKITAHIAFDLDDIDAAFEELDGRYLAGEAAAYAHTWSVMTQGYAALNQREIPPTTPDFVSIDHRRGIAFEPGDLIPYIRATWDVTPDSTLHIETVHRLTGVGAVVTHTGYGTSLEGFDAEWRELVLFTFEGDRSNHCEMFDPADLDAALARFEELQPQTPQPENAASQVDQRFWAYFADRDWDALTELIADDISVDDRRHVVNAGVRHGRDAEIANLQAMVEIGVRKITSTVVATRGARLALIRLANQHLRHEEFGLELLAVVEIDADNKMAAHIGFDLDDIDAAFEELDARYLAGEAVAHAHTWSLVSQGVYAAHNRRELAPTTPDWVNLDHRRGRAFEPGDIIPYVHATWEMAPDVKLYVETVHRLTSIGAVVTQTSRGTSQEGFEAEWREIALFTFEGDLANRCELFDETDLDTALAHFEELHTAAPKLENAASRVSERILAHFAARDWDAMAEMLADNYLTDDRRRLVGAGIRHGRDGWIVDMRATADLWISNVTSTVIATRGQRLVLARARFSHRDQAPEGFLTEYLGIVEIDADERIVAIVMIDLDDINAAFEELDARYLAGEAAANSHGWSVIARECAAFNRREIAAADYVTIDHRQLAIIEATDPQAAMRAIWDVTPDLSIHIERVHRLNSFGAVATYTAHGTSPEGLDAEWRMIYILNVEGDRINRCEIFDEADLDAALARFDELDQQAPPLENAATRIWARLADAFNRRDLDGVLAVGSAAAGYEDRRKGLGDAVDGPERRKAVLAVFEMARSSWRMEVEPIAIRGARLSVIRGCYRDIDDADRPITVEFLNVMELGDDGRMQHSVSFDPDDINGAFAELTARWIASGEVAHPEVIEAARKFHEATNRHDWDAVAARDGGATYIDHRQLAAGGTNTVADHMSSIRTMASLIPDLWIEQAEILTHSASGLVTYIVMKGTSTEGLAIELPLVVLIFLDGDHIARIETFDADKRHLALARFEELNVEGQPSQ